MVVQYSDIITYFIEPFSSKVTYLIVAPELGQLDGS